MESISIFEIIKIGIGPSSSHTMGPWKAAELFLDELRRKDLFDMVCKIRVDLYGSLALTGKGHGTDIAIVLGLGGEIISLIDTDQINAKIAKVRVEKKLNLAGNHALPFSFDDDIIFHFGQYLPFHSNGMTFFAGCTDGQSFSKSYYSIGGGFVATDEDHIYVKNQVCTPYPCHDARSILKYCDQLNLSVSDLVLLNEQTWRTGEEIKTAALQIWEEMKNCLYRSAKKTGELPGGLGVRRRAGIFNAKLLEGAPYADKEEWFDQIRKSGNNFKKINSWISCFALAVNEENASYGRVVTAPTNGASGVIPAVMAYAYCFENIYEEELVHFILVAGEIGSLFKKNATISAAVGGCQAEIGVSSAMAAAGLTECLGGSPGQVLMAAEIAMEHHLGLTCDPIAGLVQIPCIERNTMGAMKAITASTIAMQSDPSSAKVSLDAVIKTMWETAKNMHTHFKETSEGGLAVNVPVNVVEC